MKLEKIKSDLNFLKDYDTIIFGSFATGEFREGSDIDIAVITGKKDNEANIKTLKSLVGKASEIYDIRIFELLSLKVRASVMDNYLVLYGDGPEISEYFYFHHRKEWDDCKHRIEEGYYTSYKEQISAIKRFKEIKKRAPHLFTA